MSTRGFYRQPEIARGYEQQRFGSTSGARVNERELSLVEALLPAGGRVLDLACGTGRLTRRLSARGYQVVSADASLPMLRQTLASAAGSEAVLADAFRLPFVDRAFDSVVAMRLLFHYADVVPIVREMARLCRPGGLVVFDTATWSPRAQIPLAARHWGGKIFVHPPEALAAQLSSLGLEVVRRRAAFLLSPYLYRLLPLPLEQGLEALERHLPPSWCSRLFWQVRIPTDG